VCCGYGVNNLWTPCTYRVVVGKPEEKRPLARINLEGKINIKIIFVYEGVD
jgi:hypothetical protein